MLLVAKRTAARRDAPRHDRRKLGKDRRVTDGQPHLWDHDGQDPLLLGSKLERPTWHWLLQSRLLADCRNVAGHRGS